jgi:chromosome segregation ATPase
MASVSDTEDGWALLENAACSDEEQQSTPDLQSKVDALQEKTYLMQVQIKLKDDSIESLTDRLDALEAVDRQTRDCSQAMGKFHWQIVSMRGDLGIRSKDHKSSVDDLADSVRDMKDKAKRLEGEINERFEDQIDRVNALETYFKGLIEETDECIDRAMDDVKDLRSNVERLERENKERMDSLEGQNQALRDDLGHTQSIIDALHKCIDDTLARVYIEHSGLKQRIEMLEGSRQNGDSMYTATTLNQEHRVRSWEAQVYGLQGYGNGNARNYLNLPNWTVYGGFTPYCGVVRR